MLTWKNDTIFVFKDNRMMAYTGMRCEQNACYAIIRYQKPDSFGWFAVQFAVVNAHKRTILVDGFNNADDAAACVAGYMAQDDAVTLDTLLAELDERLPALKPVPHRYWLELETIYNKGA